MWAIQNIETGEFWEDTLGHQILVFLKREHAERQYKVWDLSFPLQVVPVEVKRL